MRRNQILAAITISALAAGACSVEESPVDNASPKDKVVTLVTTLSIKNDPDTRALSDPEDGTIHSEWAPGEEVWVYYENTASEGVEAKATVTSVDGSGSATISVDLVNPKSGDVSFGYPFAHYTLGPEQKDLYTDQLGTLADISENFDVAFGSAAITVAGSEATLSDNVEMMRETFIWKLSFTDGSDDITESITSLVINDGLGDYTVTPAAQSTIYVAMFPFDDATVTITATTPSGNYTAQKDHITLVNGKLYSSLGLTLSAAAVPASTTTFTYTSTAKVSAFDSLENFTGATAVTSHEFADGVGTVQFEGTVTAIADNTFYYDSNAKSKMTGIAIPESVERIGDRAFSNCSALSSVTFPGTSHLTTICGSAFAFCEALTSLSLPESLTTLGSLKTDPYEYEDGACFWFSGLQSFTLPKNVSTIYGGGHLAGCPITSLTVAAGNAKYDSRGNCNAVIETAEDELVLGCAISTVPDGIKIIGYEAFWAETQEFSITLPESVWYISNRAFHLATGLKSINFPEKLNYIGDEAFVNCILLTSLTLPDETEHIGGMAFEGCEGLQTVTLGSGLTTIMYGAFGACTGVTDVYCTADPTNLSWMGEGFKQGKATLFHVSDVSAWTTKFPEANVTFVGGEVDLSSFSGNVTAGDGDILTGTLDPAYHLTIPAGASVVLRNATIAYSGTDAAAITCEGSASIILDGTNTVSVPAGWEPMSGYPAILAGGTDTQLTLGGSGSLTAIGGYIAAGIGCLNAMGGAGYACGVIQIDGGTINAYSGNQAALGDGAEVGIGAVCGGPSGDACAGIVINGGSVTAKGYAGGIGGSGGTSVGYIQINGGTVTATGEEGAGIGICSNGVCGDISITGGTVTAIGGLSCAGIGTGCGIDPEHPSVVGDITISGGTVTAIGDECGIGTGYAGRCGNISITKGIVTAVSSSSGTVDANDGTGAGIGAGGGGVCGDILIKGGTIIAKGGWGAAGVGSASGGSSHYNSLTIDSVYFPTSLELKSLSATRGSDTAKPIGQGESDTTSPDPVYTTKVKKDTVNSTDDTWIYKVN